MHVSIGTEHLEESRHPSAIPSAKMGGGAVTAGSVCPHHSSTMATSQDSFDRLTAVPSLSPKFLGAQPLAFHLGFPSQVWKFPALLPIKTSAFYFINEDTVLRA